MSSVEWPLPGVANSSLSAQCTWLQDVQDAGSSAVCSYTSRSFAAHVSPLRSLRCSSFIRPAICPTSENDMVDTDDIELNPDAPDKCQKRIETPPHEIRDRADLVKVEDVKRRTSAALN